jgi:hypothetical protein
MCALRAVLEQTGNIFVVLFIHTWGYSKPLWSSGQTSWLQTQRSRVRFPALVRINEDLLERKLAAPVKKTEINDHGDRSVGIVRLRSKGHGVCLFLCLKMVQRDRNIYCDCYNKTGGPSQNYWGSGLCPSSGILKTRKYVISETGTLSVLGGWEEGTYSVGSLEELISISESQKVRNYPYSFHNKTLGLSRCLLHMHACSWCYWGHVNEI